MEESPACQPCSDAKRVYLFSHELLSLHVLLLLLLQDLLLMLLFQRRRHRRLAQVRRVSVVTRHGVCPRLGRHGVATGRRRHGVGGARAVGRRSGVGVLVLRETQRRRCSCEVGAAPGERRST